MKILMVQADIAWEQPQQNREHIATLVHSAGSADLIVLPEMFTTGFTMNPAAVAEREGEPTLAWMLALARECDAAVAGSVAVEDNDRYYNRLYFACPDGSYDTYDKRHLFSFAGEHRNYSAGTERVIVTWRGFRILLQTCYDLRFPVFARNHNDYDMILYIANWPLARIAAWDILLRARAIENACYVVGVNRVGRDRTAQYPGHSALIDFKGETMATPQLFGADTHCDNMQYVSTDHAPADYDATDCDVNDCNVANNDACCIVENRAGDCGVACPTTAYNATDRNSADHEVVFCGHVEKQPLDDFRHKFPALCDADAFSMEL